MPLNKPTKTELCCLGAFVLYWSWNFCVLVSNAFTAGIAEGILGNAWLWSSAAHAATIVALGTRARNKASCCENFLILSAGPTCSLAGLCLFLAAGITGLPPAATVLAGSLLVGLGTGCLMLSWSELFSAAITASRRGSLLLAALAACAILNAVFAVAPRPVGVLMVLAMPMACAALVHLGAKDLAGQGGRDTRAMGDEPPATRNTHRLGWRFYANCLVYTLPLGFFQSWFRSDGGDAGQWVVGMVISAIALAAVAALDASVRRRMGKSGVQNLVLPVTIAGLFMLTMLDRGAAALPGTLIFIATQLLSATLYPAFASIAEGISEPPARVFGMGVAATDCGYIVGMLATYALQFLPGNVVLCVILGIAYLVVMVAFLQVRGGEGTLELGVQITQGTDGPAPSNDGTPSPTRGHSTAMRAAIARTSAEHGLTERESQVLGYLIGGKTAAAIGEEMGLSANTVRTHVAHVYQKLGVHGKDSLIFTIESKMNDEMPDNRAH